MGSLKLTLTFILLQLFFLFLDTNCFNNLLLENNTCYSNLQPFIFLLRSKIVNKKVQYIRNSNEIILFQHKLYILFFKF